MACLVTWESRDEPRWNTKEQIASRREARRLVETGQAVGRVGRDRRVATGQMVGGIGGDRWMEGGD